MKEREYLLIALDMDGTLLNSGQEITPRAGRAMEEIMRRGKQVVFSTGRCIREMEAYLEAFPSMKYLICESGACVYDLQKKKHIARIPIPPRLVLKVIACVEGEDILTSFLWETVRLWIRPICGVLPRSVSGILTRCSVRVW